MKIRTERVAPARRLAWAGATVLLVLGLMPMHQAQAGQNDDFGVTPSPVRFDGGERRTFTIPLEQGRVFEDAVRIYSRSDEPITVNVYPAEAVIDDEGVVSVGFQRSQPPGLAGWIEMQERSVHLRPGEEAIVSWRIRIADTAPEPELGAIVVESAAVGEGAFDLVERIAILVRPAEPGAATGAVVVDGADEGRWSWLLLIVPLAVLAVLAAILVRRRVQRDADADADTQVVFEHIAGDLSRRS